MVASADCSHGFTALLSLRFENKIEPVTAAQFHAPGCCAGNMLPRNHMSKAERATLDVFATTSGIRNSSGTHGKRHVLARRITNYDPKMARSALPELGRWAGDGCLHILQHLKDSAAGKRRVIPTSVAPITFFRSRRSGLDDSASSSIGSTRSTRA